MSSSPDGWLPLLFTTLGAGALGSVITTYGAQGKFRRKTRSRALAALQEIESTRRARQVGEGFGYNRQVFAELEARCMVAGVPRRLVYWFDALSEAASGRDMHPGPIVAVFHLISYSSYLIHQSLWHPLLSRIAQPFRLRRLRRAIDRCSKVSPLEWLRDINDGKEPVRLGSVRGWVKEVDEQGRGQAPK
jgi:hypothetical protein